MGSGGRDFCKKVDGKQKKYEGMKRKRACSGSVAKGDERNGGRERESHIEHVWGQNRRRQ